MFSHVLKIANGGQMLAVVFQITPTLHIISHVAQIVYVFILQLHSLMLCYVDSFYIFSEVIFSEEIYIVSYFGFSRNHY